MQITPKMLKHWKADPVAFVREVLRDPETGQPFELYEAEERFIREALTLHPMGACPSLNWSTALQRSPVRRHSRQSSRFTLSLFWAGNMPRPTVWQTMRINR